METHVNAKAFITSEDELLVLRRNDNVQQRPGDWDIPGGCLESGESPFAGVAREVYEETGLLIPERDFALLYASTEVDKMLGSTVVRLFFKAETPSRLVTLSDEHTSGLWLPRQEVRPNSGGKLTLSVPHMVAFDHIFGSV